MSFLTTLFAVLQELVSDVHCIIDAMIGKESGVGLLCPSTEGVPDVRGLPFWAPLPLCPTRLCLSPSRPI